MTGSCRTISPTWWTAQYGTEVPTAVRLLSNVEVAACDTQVDAWAKARGFRLPD